MGKAIFSTFPRTESLFTGYIAGRMSGRMFLVFCFVFVFVVVALPSALVVIVTVIDVVIPYDLVPSKAPNSKHRNYAIWRSVMSL